mmetsp:Transcript_107580/g.304253  ORF Transcript_107580/g.304253 Transcript_107580/m.304253 type:complete len:306 (-) Transcript_107580:477-1394(-)
MLRQEGALLLRAVWQGHSPLGLPGLLNVADKAAKLLPRKLLQPLLHRPPLLLERLHHPDAGLLRRPQHLDLDRLVECLSVEEVALGRLCMRVEVKARTVGDASALQPAKGCLDLGIPAVVRIVRHLCRQVLAEADMVFPDPDADKEEVCACDQVAEGLIVDHAGRNCLADRQLNRCLAGQLFGRREEFQHDVLDKLELGVLLGVWLHKVLDLSLRDLPEPCEATRRNLIPVDLADLRYAEGEAVRVLLQAELVVQEDTLRRLGPQEPLDQARRANRHGEHEVERLRLRQKIARVGGTHVVLLENI